MKANFRIFRYNPKNGAAPRYDTFEVEWERGTTVLDCLNYVKWYVDGSLAYRRSCRHGICGSCAMNINGHNDLACHLQVEHLNSDTVTVNPLPGMRVLKDLVVDMAPFYQAYEAVMPYMVAKEEAPENAEFRQSLKDRHKLDEVINCIMCNCCTSSCPSFWGDEVYLGPAALTKAWRFTADSRDGAIKERLALVNNDNGVWRCHTIFNCARDCPKEINCTDAIARLKRRIILRKFGFR